MITWRMRWGALLAAGGLAAGGFAAGAFAAAGSGFAATPSYAPVVAGHPLQFPADYGSHPQFRTEWWYVTGWLTTEQGEPLGFQITFFRTKPPIEDNNPAHSPRTSF